MRSSILVLNYNGMQFLKDCFASLGPASRDGRAHDVYLVDNGSTDGSLEYMAQAFPWVKCIQASRNAYGFSYNEIMPQIETEAIILLNNDVIVEPDFVAPLVEHLHQSDVFAVNTRILTGDRVTPQGSRTSGGYHRGLWWYKQLPDLDRTSTSFFVPNQCAYSRSKYMELGGFDELFWPMYHEDIDLSYRAWRRGWRILYEPRSVLYHLGGQTRTAKGQIWHRTVETQNAFLLQWKNIDDPQMRREHLAWLPSRLARAAAMGDMPFLKGFKSAMSRSAAMKKQRALEMPARRVSDHEAFSRIMAGINGI